MTMSRKDFIRFAESFAMNKPEDKDSKEYSLWKTLVRDIAGDCINANSNFSRSRFYTACGLED